MKRLVLVAGLIAAGSIETAFAGGVVSNVLIQSTGTGPTYDTICGFPCMVVEFQSAPTGSPCSLNSGWHYAINISTAEGRLTAAQVTTAKATGNVVESGGNGTCIYNGRIEQFAYLILK